MGCLRLLLFSSVVSAASFTLHHRILDPDVKLAPPFLPRATIEVSNGQPLIHLHSEGVLSLQKNPEHLWYQVALEHESHKDQSDWFIQSVQGCHALANKADHILLHSLSEDVVLGFDYFVVPLPKNGACASNNINVGPSNVAFTNTTVAWRSVTIEPITPLRTPPQLTEKGEPLQPPPDPPFIQKYWMYIIGAMLLFLVAAPSEPGPEEEGPSK